MGFVILILALSILPFSVQSAEAGAMVYTVPTAQRVTGSSKYYQNIVVDQVTGGSETKFYTNAKIGNDQFKQALEKSLKSANMLSTLKTCTYHLTVALVTLDQQSFGEDPHTAVKVTFTLKNMKTGVAVFADTYDDNDSATTKDSLWRGKKVKLATERAARGVIHKVLDRLLM
jgi:hypothetical protein